MQLGGSVFVAEQNMHDSLCVPFSRMAYKVAKLHRASQHKSKHGQKKFGRVSQSERLVTW